jgi:phytoene synthase
LSLYALNIELAGIRDAVTEPALGEIRLQWWLDSIDAIYAGATSPQPVIQELAAAIEYAELPNSAFRNMILARRFDIYDDPMPTLNDLEGYLGDTASALIQLAAMILDGDDAKSCGEVSGLAGVAMGVSGILRSLPLDRARGRCFVPAEMLVAA